MKTPRATDKRVLRTRAKLRDALVALVIERGWDKVAIQDVCERANVGRSTFYTHFADKEDLLLIGFDDLRAMLRLTSKIRAATGTGLGFTRALLEHANENRRLFRALVGNRSSHVVQRRFLQLVVDLTEEELSAALGSGVGLEVTVNYLAGALFQLVIWWLESRKPMPPEKLDAIFHQLTKPVLSAARVLR